MDEGINKSVLQTLAYFDVFDHPLTKEELFRYLLITDNPDLRMTYTDFVKNLDDVGGIGRKQSFYFLPGREDIVDKKQRLVKFFEEKMKIARRGIKKLRWIPFVRSVFVCNTVASSGLTEESDIDVFIIVKNKRLWLTRLLVTLILSLSRLRRTKKKIQNKICLSFYVADNHLNISDVALEGIDIYQIYWLADLIPVYDPENLLYSIQKANKHVEQKIPRAFQPYDLLHRYKVKDRKVTKMIKNFFEKMWNGGYGDILENQAKQIQKSKMKRNLKSVQGEKDTRVVISDEVLKFHENDRREEYREKWMGKCRVLGI